MRDIKTLLQESIKINEEYLVENPDCKIAKLNIDGYKKCLKTIEENEQKIN